MYIYVEKYMQSYRCFYHTYGRFYFNYRVLKLMKRHFFKQSYILIFIINRDRSTDR